jgi:hypothetical protein
MEKDDKQKFARAIDENILKSVEDAKFPLWRRAHWDEWGSPVGLSLGWALFVIPLGIFIYLLHLAGIVG